MQFSMTVFIVKNLNYFHFFSILIVRIIRIWIRVEVYFWRLLVKFSFFLGRFLAQTGLVSIENQMRDLDLVPNAGSETNKKRT